MALQLHQLPRISCHCHVLHKIAEVQFDVTVFRLVDILTLFITTKQCDNLSIIDANTLAHVSHGNYFVHEIIGIEQNILEVFQ